MPRTAHTRRSAARDRKDLGKVVLRNGRTGGKGPRLDGGKYSAVRRAILKCVPRAPRSIGFAALIDAVRRHLPEGEIPGGGSIPWYVTSVKLDMEARGELICDRDASPQTLSRASGR